jgi:hypothetical protein
MPGMSLFRHIARVALHALAIVAVLSATFGVHLHLEEDVHDHHHDAMGHHHHDGEVDGVGHEDDEEPAGGTGGFVLHAHDSLVQSDRPQVLVTTLVESLGVTFLHPEFHLRVPSGLARDIDPPPNKRVL